MFNALSIISYLIYIKIKPLEILLFVKSKCNQILVPKPIYLSSFEKIYEKSKIKRVKNILYINYI